MDVVSIAGSLVRALASIELSVFLILGLFIVATVGMFFFGDRQFFSGLAANAPTMLTSLGIVFTFMGVLRGLLDFDINDIDAAIVELLEGLKVAFISSVLGISMAFIFRLLQVTLSTAESASDDVYDIMRNGLKEISQAIGGSGEGSLISRFEQMQQSFEAKMDDLSQTLKDFAQEIVDKSTEAVLQALTDVIRDFNLKLTEQFGENLQKFNAGVGEFLAWQEKNRRELDELNNSFLAVRQSLETSAEKMNEISSSTGKIPEQLEALSRVQKIFQEEMEQLYSSLGALAEVRVKAQEMLPAMETGIKEVMSTFQNTNELATSTVRELSTEMQNLQGKTADALTSSTQLIDSVAEGLRVTIGDAQKGLQEATESGIAGITTAITQLDNSMQEEVQRCVEVMGNNVTRITEEFVGQYERLAKDTRAADAARQSLEGELLKNVSAEVKKAVSSARS